MFLLPVYSFIRFLLFCSFIHSVGSNDVLRVRFDQCVMGREPSLFLRYVSASTTLRIFDTWMFNTKKNSSPIVYHRMNALNLFIAVIIICTIYNLSGWLEILHSNFYKNCTVYGKYLLLCQTNRVHCDDSGTR